MTKFVNTRKHFTRIEVDRMIAVTRGHRNAARDGCLLLLMFRHGLRVSEACSLKTSQVDIEGQTLRVERMKKGLSTVHPLRAEEVQAVKAWLIERKRMNPQTDTLFVSERLSQLNRRTVWAAIKQYGELARLQIKAHPHMLRHACGYELANQGADAKQIQDYLGHRNIQYTAEYTAPQPTKFEKFWL